jgi:hypothetical protein
MGIKKALNGYDKVKSLVSEVDNDINTVKKKILV